MNSTRFHLILWSMSIGLSGVFVPQAYCAQPPDSQAAVGQRGCFGLAVGANLWDYGKSPYNGAATFFAIQPVWGDLGVQFDFGAWDFRVVPVAFRIGVALRYDFNISEKFAVFPKAGIGFVAIPESFSSVGGGLSFAISKRVRVFAEGGSHFTYREIWSFTNSRLWAHYFSTGLLIQVQ
jgi:hypothetical protein